jgi:uncharacterized protein
MSRYYAIALLTCLLLLSSCAKLPDNYGLYQEPPSAWTIEQNNNRLSTIESLVQSSKSSAAKQQADLINPTELTSPQTAKYILLYAQILLSFGEAEQAAKKLATIDMGQLSIGDKIRYYQSNAFAYSLSNNLLESAKARIALDPLLTKVNERKKNQTLILESLGLLPETVSQNPQNQTGGLPEWLAIAKILSSRNQNPAKFNASLASWRAANPQHPANIYLTNVENKPDDTGSMPKSIAVLLPESGPYADAGKAVKAGFLAAHSRDNNSSKPELHFYDTEKAKPAELYQKAVNEGAKLVIGPLNKESIQSLANSAILNIPVLALNHVPDLNKQNLYQFALSPMDDVAEITQKAESDGHKKALLLAPENDQSKRVVNYFASSWQSQGGSILEKKTYDPKTADYSTTIKKLLNLDESDERFRKILSYFPAAKSVPRKRQDADVIFLSAYSKEGRVINSQLQLQQAGNLAVYAMPTIYSGIVDSVSDNPLNGITFCDMPWLFNAAYGGELSMMSLRNIWSQFPNTYIRLLAMGIDAYHLGAKLPTLGTTQYSGATGNLSLTSGNRIKRSLVCAKFVLGQPELIGFTHNPAEGEFSGAEKSVTTVSH